MEYECHQYKIPILINNIAINKIVLSNKFPFGKQDFKCLIGYTDSEKIAPLCIFSAPMIIYKGNFMKIDIFIF